MIALVTVVLIGHVLGDANFGRMQMAVTYSALASIVADFGFATLYVREGARRPDLVQRLLGFAMSMRVFLTAVAGPLLFAGLWFAGIQSLWLPAFAIIFIGGYLQLLRSTLYATQRLNFEIAEIIPESLLLLGLVVLGAHTEKIRPVLARLPVLITENPAWSEGMAASIRAGVTTLQQFSRGLDAALITLCDQPAFSADTIAQLTAAQRSTGRSIVAARYAGRHGAPALHGPYKQEVVVARPVVTVKASLCLDASGLDRKATQRWLQR